MDARTPRRCSQCGAPLEAPEVERCSFCGQSLPLTAAAPSGPAAARSASVAELLAEVERHPEIGAWRALVPSSGGAVLGPAIQLVSGVVFAGVALGMLVFMRSFDELPAFIGFLPLLFVALGGGIVVHAAVKLAQYAAAPLERVPALIADKRTHVAGGGNSHNVTTYFATLERADGTRSECQVDAQPFGAIAAGDFGLAFVRGGALLEFRRVGQR